MRERNQILEFWQNLTSNSEPAVLATVVRTEGSSYRLPGARLLLAQDGRRVGSVSGGCLEDDIVKKAWWLTADGPVVRKYDTTPDGEISTDGYGLGCNGVVYVLLERVTRQNPSVLPLLKKVKQTRRAATVTHPLCVPPFVEQILPATHLLIFGAGDDAVPLSQLAHYLGWEVSVFDGRAHYARREKFPLADRVIVRPAGSPAPPVDSWTAAVVMTHSYSQDLEAVGMLKGQPLRYLGVLGPRKRTRQLLEESDSPSADLHSPMGLDLGADGPEQVALAVTAEIQAVLNGRNAGFLRDRGGPIHTPDTASAENTWVRSIVCA